MISYLVILRVMPYISIVGMFLVKNLFGIWFLMMNSCKVV